MQIDDGNFIGTAGGKVNSGLVGRDRHTEGQGRVALQLVQRKLDNTTGFFAKDYQSVSECPAVRHVRERDEILRAERSGDPQAAIWR